VARTVGGRRERLPQPGPVAVGAGEAVVDVDALGLNAARLEGVASGGEILRVGGDAGAPDLELGHIPDCVPFVGRSPARFTEPLLRHTPPPRGGEVAAQGDGCAGGGSRYATVSERDE
jgi:hypothetical protein